MYRFELKKPLISIIFFKQPVVMEISDCLQVEMVLKVDLKFVAVAPGEQSVMTSLEMLMLKLHVTSLAFQAQVSRSQYAHSV